MGSRGTRVWCVLEAPECSTLHHRCRLDDACRQRQLVPLGQRVPTLAPDAWVAPNAVLIGDVDLYDRVSWEGRVM